MSRESEKNQNIGFSGFDNMISDISTDLKVAPHPKKPKTQSQKQSIFKVEKTNSGPKKKTRTDSWTSNQTPNNTNNASPMQWFAIIIGILFIISLVNMYSDKTKHSSSNSYQKPPSESTYIPSSSTYNTNPTTTISLRPTESKPPFGTNNVLNREQIRYCLAQGIRIDAIMEKINHYSDTEINKSNALVSDYNDRCGQFRYRSGDQSGAERDISNHKTTYVKEGYAILQSWRGFTPVKKDQAKVDQTVLSIQQRLNSMGYQSGGADGIMGRKTREAIKSYQKDNYLDVNGKPTRALLTHMIEKSNN